jgi:DNA polymerase alpha subunit A
MVPFQPIRPPISCLCESIEGTSQHHLAQILGLDSSKFNQVNRSSMDIDGDVEVDYTPASFLSDTDRFKDVEKLKLFCFACGVENEFPGDIGKDAAAGQQMLVSGLHCTNPDCTRPNFWGQANHFEFYSRLTNTMSIWVRGLMTKYYEGRVRCDEHGCSLETRQLSVAGGICLRRGCNGRMQPVDTERDVHSHLKYLESLFNEDHVCEQLEKQKKFGRKVDMKKVLSKPDQETFKELHQVAKHRLESNAFNWISPNFWKGLFPVGTTKQ